MVFLFQKFREAVKLLAKSPTFAKDGRHLQFEADMNRLFLYTSYNRLGKNADEADADEIIDMASKASLAEQQKQVQENIHSQIQSFFTYLDDILCPDKKTTNTMKQSSERNTAPRCSGLRLAVGRTNPLDIKCTHMVDTKPLTRFELSHNLKDLTGYTLEVKPSQIPNKDAGHGLFLDGEADVGSVIAIYPGITYSPACYRYIPGYPRVDLKNPYLITRYDGIIINAQPWGAGCETREIWDGSNFQEPELNAESGSDRVWKLLSKPLNGSIVGVSLERRNPLAFAHFANHPTKGMPPNVMVCPYDYPLGEESMRAYIPNVSFGDEEDGSVRMRKFGSFWFKSWKWGGNDTSTNVPILKSLVLVATRGICNEEILLNYRLSNLKSRPSWYFPVDEEEDRRRWS